MDWLKARSFRKLGSISATLSVDAGEEPAEELDDVLVLLDELEPQAAAARATATLTTSTAGRGNR
jgi:hypothetical protein